MDDFEEKIHYKKTKLNKILSDLNNEISSCVSCLLRLRNHSMDIVRKLNSRTTPAIYFEEFVIVNSSILKYLGLLGEINCKFEMLEMSEKIPNNLPPDDDNSVTSEFLSQISDVPDFKSSKSNDIDCTDERKTLAEDNLKKPVETSDSEHSKCGKNEDMNCDILESKKEMLNSYLCSFRDNETNSSRSIISESDKPDSPLAKKYRSSCSRRKLSDSEAESTEISHNPVRDEKLKEKALVAESVPVDTVNSSEVQVQQNETDAPNVDVSVTDIAPTKVNQASTCSDSESAISRLRKTNNESKTKLKEKEISEEKPEDVIEPVSISTKPGSEYEVTIESIRSPCEFYVYIKNWELDLFFELMKKLKDFGNEKNRFWNRGGGGKKGCLKEGLGTNVLFYSKCDEIWYRAKVIDRYLNYKDDFVKIFLIDHGEYKCVSVKDLEPMPEGIKKYPAFVRRCHLYGVLPSDLSEWEKESLEKMQSLTEMSKQIKIRVAPKDDVHCEQSLPVTVWLLDENKECVNELLVKDKLAVFDSNCDKGAFEKEVGDGLPSENEDLSQWNPMKDDFEAYENSYELEIDDPATYIYGYVGKDYDRICKHFAQTGQCFKGNACRKEHKRLDRLGFTRDQEEVYKNAFNSLVVPSLKSVAVVAVTCFLGSNNFCAVLQNQSESVEEENLHSLFLSMNRPENVRGMKKLLIPPSTGQIVLARFSEDQSWYRAKILDSQPENDAFSVLYVDYGNKETVSLSDIRAVEGRYLHLPFQALHCFIFGIERNPKVPVEDAIDYLNKRINEKPITIEIVSKLPGEDVTLLVHAFDENGTNIGEDLLANNYAIPKEELIVSSESCSMPG